MRIVKTLVLLLGILPLAAELRAQEPYPFKRGDEVRFYREDLTCFSWDTREPDAAGTVLALTSDSVFLLTHDGATSGVPLDSIRRIEVNRGPHSHWLKGMTAGAVFGAGAGLIAGLITSYDTRGCQTGLPLELSADCQDYALPVLARVGLGALAGGLIGATIGSFVKTDRWETTPFDRATVRLIAGRDRVGLAASLRF